MARRSRARSATTPTRTSTRTSSAIGPGPDRSPARAAASLPRAPVARVARGRFPLRRRGEALLLSFGDLGLLHLVVELEDREREGLAAAEAGDAEGLQHD